MPKLAIWLAGKSLSTSSLFPCCSHHGVRGHKTLSQQNPPLENPRTPRRGCLLLHYTTYCRLKVTERIVWVNPLHYSITSGHIAKNYSLATGPLIRSNRLRKGLHWDHFVILQQWGPIKVGAKRHNFRQPLAIIVFNPRG